LTVSFVSITPAACTVLGTSVTLIGAGTCTIQAIQGGNASYLAAPLVSQSFQVLAASQTITFGALSNQSLGTALVTIGATASSNLGVSFTSLTPSVCTVLGTSVTIAGAGTCTIQATQAGNANYLAAPPVNQSFQALQEAQSITLGIQPVHTYGDAPFVLSGTATSGLPVTFALTSGPCSLSGTTVTIAGAGTCLLTASQGGNADWAAATVNQALQVAPAVLTVTANSVTILTGSALPSFTAQFTGFVRGDTFAVVSGAASLTTTATGLSPAGLYPIVAAAGTLAAANYTFRFVNGTLTVTAPPPPPNFLSINPAAIAVQYVQGTIPVSSTQGLSIYSRPGSIPFTLKNAVRQRVEQVLECCRGSSRAGICERRG
jgi:hypothetical protein